MNKIDKLSKSLSKLLPEEDMLQVGSKIEFKPFSSGIASLDAAIGGIPNHGIVEILGKNSSTKTSHLLLFAKSFMEMHSDEPVVIIDMERTITNSFVKGFGIDPDRIIFLYPDTAEQAFNAVRIAATNGAKFIGFDSIDAAEAQSTVEKDFTTKEMSPVPRLLSQMVRRISKMEDVVFIFLNQWRQKPTMYGDPRTSSGGDAVGYYSILRLNLKAVPNQKDPSMLSVTAEVLKNKMRSKSIPITYLFNAGKGIDPIADLIASARDHGIIETRGKKVILLEEDMETEISNKGIPYLKEILTTDSALVERIKELLLQAPPLENESVE